TIDDDLRHAEDSLYATDQASPFQLKEMRRLVEGHEPQPTLEPIVPSRAYDVRYLIAPVFGPDGRPAIVLRLFGIDARLPGREVLKLRDALLAACEEVSRRLGGRRPSA